jgi:biopolymer transport protein TolQ
VQAGTFAGGFGSANVKAAMQFLTHTATLFMWLQQAVQPDQTTAAAPAASRLGDSAVMEMLRNSGPVAIIVLVLLLLTSLYSWAIMLSKWSSFRRARVQSARFVRAFRKANRLEEIAAVSEQFKPSPLATVFDETYGEYQRQTGGHGGPPRNIAALERASQTAASEALTLFESRMTWLATIGAVSPFLGLFGTIWGIIDAFHGLGTAGAATLRAVAPGVSEALITTAAGLAVAVPAVVGYNQFTSRIREFAARLDDFAREMLNAIEDSTADEPPRATGPGEAPVTSAAPAPRHAGAPLHSSHSSLPRY